jgi:hypothetical protein
VAIQAGVSESGKHLKANLIFSSVPLEFLNYGMSHKYETNIKNLLWANILPDFVKASLMERKVYQH